MTVSRKKLIEVGLPLEAINRACKEDKDRKTGHIRNLHKWYAPMPLPAWRAALFTSLIDDPKVDGVSDEAADAARQRIFELLKVILPLDAAKKDSVFDPVRELIRTSCKQIPTVIDPFCGGGSTLLEAQRLGLRAIGSDLNPIPVLITTVLTRYPSLFSDIPSIAPKKSGELDFSSADEIGLVRDVRYYAELIGQRARNEIALLYPSLTVRLNGSAARDATVISWIWSRTVKCPNPACGVITPLASSFELTRSIKGSKAYWVEPKVDKASRKITYTVRSGPGKPPKPPKIGRGAKFECVACHSIIDEKHLHASVRSEPLGFGLMACVAKLPSGERVYLSPTSEALATVTAPSLNWVPDLELSTHPQYMGAPRYGMKTVGDLFTPRQLKAIEVFARNVRDIRKEVEEHGRARLGDRAALYADAITTILALCVSKFSQSHNVLVRWKLDSRNGSGKPLPAFDTQTVPIVWDFAENNPFGGSVGDWSKTVVPTALRAFDYCVPKACPVEVLQEDARSAFEIGSGPLFIATDPPYYDNVPYADLSDVFYPLLRFMLRDVHPKLFATLRSPRTTELVADYHRLGGSREKARAYFLDGFRDVFKGLKTRADKNAPMIVVYSFKQQEEGDDSTSISTGWEVMLHALIESGFSITATWPVRTTLQNRSRDIDSNALASAILIVCRPRPDTAAKATRREFQNALRQELPSAVWQLQRNNIAPVDLQQSMIGPGMAIFSRYREVVDLADSSISVREALILINQTLDELLADQESDFDTDTRWAVAWFDQQGFAVGEYGVAEVLATAKNTSISGMVAADIVESKRGKVRLLKAAELPEDWDPAGAPRLSAWQMVHQLIRALEAGGESGAASLMAKLGNKAEIARELAYRLYTIAERKKRAVEALSYNGLVQSWPEIARLSRAEALSAEPSQATLL